MKYSIIIIILMFFSSCRSQLVDKTVVIDKSNVNMYARQKFNSCYELNKKKLENDSVSTIYNISKKEDLGILPLPIFKFNDSIISDNFFNKIDFKDYNSQIVFILDKEKNVVSEFLTQNCFEPFSLLKNLRTNVIGAKRLYFSLYNFNFNSFYFFLEDFDGLFEIYQNKVYYIYPHFNANNTTDIYLDMDLKFVKKFNVIEFIKMDCNFILSDFNKIIRLDNNRKLDYIVNEYRKISSKKDKKKFNVLIKIL